MSGRYLLDTAILVAILGDEPNIREKLQQASDIFVPPMALGELYFATFGTDDVRKTQDDLADFVSHCVIPQCDADTAREYGTLKESVWSRGLSMSENDLWIAALARQHNLVLVTRDKPFKRLSGVKTVEW